MSSFFINEKQQAELKSLLKGDVFFDKTTLLLYSTDASAYREEPLAVVYPRDSKDLELIIGFANKYHIPVIPRAAGTSLAGQVVGKGIVVDVSKYLNHILEVNKDEKWVIVEPGVVLDELNKYLRTYNLFFGPETSTSNRCNMGGMVGNNSCGSHSLIYGSTRDHLLEVWGYLSNGEKVHFKALSLFEFDRKREGDSLEAKIYADVYSILIDADNRQRIELDFPHPDIKRRNTGYAIDILANMQPFNSEGDVFNMSKLIAGSEGTLMFISKIKLNLVDLPPKYNALVCVHFDQLKKAVIANVDALKHEPVAIELMDKLVLDLSKRNTLQNKNRFFIEGDPAALLLVEFAEYSHDKLDEKTRFFVNDFEEKKYGYAHPVLHGSDINKVWSLRKAGLGILSNMPGDELPVPVIEDTAILPADLPMYVDDIKLMLKELGKECVYYAHIGTGELHLRPVLNMKREDDVKLFREIAERTAKIVKKYRGSLSGEHGDGRLRGEFIQFMVGENNYNLLRRIKNSFDPKGLLNPGKIIDTPPMDSSLRYSSKVLNNITPVFRWEKTGGIVQGADKCTGSADCRKSSVIGGTMCPSFMVTRNEKDSTRARANILREFFTGNIQTVNEGIDEVYKILDLCLSCKACKNECPSSIDITKLKAEFLNYYHSKKGIRLREWFVAYQPYIYQFASKWPGVFNSVIRQKTISKLVLQLLGFKSDMVIPSVTRETLEKWHLNNKSEVLKKKDVKIFLLADEFVNYSDDGLGIKTVHLFEKLGYEIKVTRSVVSGRTFLSKGFLQKAKLLANENVLFFKDIINDNSVLLGVEPSAILCFRDEYPELVSDNLRNEAEILAKKVFTVEEFIWSEMENGNIIKDQFLSDKGEVMFHAHCYQKALSETSVIKKILEFPVNSKATEIKSGCCGMAGSFGLEKEHALMAKQIGEMVLFPAIRSKNDDEVVVAPGTSCRQHIFENTGVKPIHPVEYLLTLLKQ
ncbi:MAG: FAD-binding oxidoreductase [Marinilabiliaceae bacterium]|nr:FAD-binding oxidoreductase [Marinilabiliaceae bacterium]